MAQPDATQKTNVAHLQRAAGVCTELGDRYQPVQEIIQPAVLNAFCTDCEVALTKTYAQERAYDEARAARKAHFSGLAPFGTRIVNALLTCGASDSTVAEARDLVHKIRGTRAGKKPKAAGSATAGTEVARQISTAQTTFDSRGEHLRKLLQLARGLGAGYRPSAAALKLDALEGRLKELSEANTAVVEGGTAYSTALIERDRLLYHEETGLGARLKAIRAEFKAAFGTKSAEFQLLKGIRVRALKNERLQAV